MGTSLRLCGLVAGTTLVAFGAMPPALGASTAVPRPRLGCLRIAIPHLPRCAPLARPLHVYKKVF